MCFDTVYYSQRKNYLDKLEGIEEPWTYLAANQELIQYTKDDKTYFELLTYSSCLRKFYQIINSNGKLFPDILAIFKRQVCLTVYTNNNEQ